MHIVMNSSDSLFIKEVGPLKAMQSHPPPPTLTHTHTATNSYMYTITDVNTHTYILQVFTPLLLLQIYNSL